MPTPQTPNWSAARSGLLGDTSAVDASAQVNQFLGTHASTEIYRGSEILTPNGQGVTPWQYHLDAYDIAQPFTMSGTTVGRVVVPLLPVGNGADLTVSLYTNNAGVPGTQVTSTRVPASWIYQQSVVAGIAGPSSASPILLDTGNPLGTAVNYTFHAGPWTNVASWSFPSVDTTSLLVPNGGSAVLSGGYFMSAGGLSGGSTVVANVFTYQYQGGTVIGTAIAQPSLPQALDFAAATSTNNTVIVLGGTTAVTEQSTVYTASWDGAGKIGAWSQQAALPQPVNNTTTGAATWNNTTVYLVGGSNSLGAVTLNTVYWATVQNGQITAWNTGQALPLALTDPNVAVFGNTLVVVGGFPAATPISKVVYFAAINSDGSLGPWQTGPSSFVGTTNDSVSMASGMFIIGAFVGGVPTKDLQSLSFDASGPGNWSRQNYNGTLPNILDAFGAAFPSGTDQWQVFFFGPGSGYLTTTLTRTPMLSVPLPATGLSNGTTYHIVLSQPNGDLNDYLCTHDDLSVFPGNPTMLTRANGSSTWVTGTSQHAVPIQIYDKSMSGPPGSAGGQPWHTWEDGGARISTLAYATTPDRRLLGILDATAQPGPVLNSNPTFTTGVAPWHATGATVAQSSAQTHGNLPFSALVTPSGSATLSYIESDLVAVQQGHSYVATAWLYSPTGYSNVTVSVNWFNAAQTYLSTTNGVTISIAANTWTQVQTTVTNNVANAVYADIVPIEGGTPPNTSIFYVSAATIQDTSGPQVSTVGAYQYAGTWPSSGVWPPTGFIGLA